VQLLCTLGAKLSCAKNVKIKYIDITQRKTMGTKVAINGFGRIGRLVFAALVEQGS